MAFNLPTLPLLARRSGAVAALVGAAVLAGCGGGSTKTTGTTAAPGGVTTTTAAAVPTSASTTAAPGASTTTAKPGSAPARPGSPTTAHGQQGGTTTTVKPTASAADVNRAKGYLLTQNDVGSDYKPQDNNGANSGSGDLEKCGQGNPVFAKSNPNSFQGGMFSKGASYADSATASSSATVAASVAEASSAMGIIKTDQFLRCVEQTAKDDGAKNAPPGSTFDVHASRRALTGADDAVDIHITVTGTYGSGPTAPKFTVDIDAFTYRKDKFIAAAEAVITGPSYTGEPARIADVMKNKIG